jgi:hypothetical protein
MAPHPSLAVLKKGLSQLVESVKKCRDALLLKIKKADPADCLTDAEEHWLDNNANHVEEDAIIQKLDREDREINGGDDNHQDSSGEPKPTRKEALRAISTLSQFLADIDGAFARKLEVSLSAFGRETQYEETKNLVSTSITDYFAQK